MNNNAGFRMWKSGKKWLVSGAVSGTVLFGPSNLIGAADTISAFLSDTSEASINNKKEEDTQKAAPEEIVDKDTEQKKESQDSSIEQTSPSSDSDEVPSTTDLPTIKMSGLTLDMDTTTPSIENTVNYTLTPDGLDWPSSAGNTRQISVSASVTIGDIIKITIPKGVTVQAYDSPSGSTVNKNTVNGATELTYTFTTS